MPSWLGGCRVGEPSLDLLRHPARLADLPLSPDNVERTIVGRLCQPGGLAASSRRDRVLPAPSASPGSRRLGNGASAEGLAPRMRGSSFLPLTVFPHWLLITMISASWGFSFVTAFFDEIRSARGSVLFFHISRSLSYESLSAVILSLSMTSVALSTIRPEKQ